MTGRFDRFLKAIDYCFRGIFAAALLLILLIIVGAVCAAFAKEGRNGEPIVSDGLMVFGGFLTLIALSVWAMVLPFMLRDPLFLYGEAKRRTIVEREARLAFLRERHPVPVFHANCGPTVFTLKLVADWMIRCTFALFSFASPLACAIGLIAVEEWGLPPGVHGDAETILWIGVAGIGTSLLTGCIFLICGWRSRYVNGLPPLQVLAFRDELAELEQKEYEARQRYADASVMLAEFVEQHHIDVGYIARATQRR